MDDLGTILYLVFAVLAAVFSMIKKNNQRKKTNSPTPSAEPDSGSVLDDLLPEFKKLFDEPRTEPTPVENFEPDPELFKKPEPKPREITIEEKKRQLDRISTLDTKAKAANKTKQQKPIEVEDETEENWFNARQAIIYSEILKRPEY